MKRVKFGNMGLEVSRIGLGGFPFGSVNQARGWDPYSSAGRETALATIHKALDLGINYVDTAPGYGNGNSESSNGLLGSLLLNGRRCGMSMKSV